MHGDVPDKKCCHVSFIVKGKSRAVYLLYKLRNLVESHVGQPVKAVGGIGPVRVGAVACDP